MVGSVRCAQLLSCVSLLRVLILHRFVTVLSGPFGERQGTHRQLVDFANEQQPVASLPRGLLESPAYSRSNLLFQRFTQRFQPMVTSKSGRIRSFLGHTDTMEDPRMFVSRQGKHMLLLQRLDKIIWVGPLSDTSKGGHVQLSGIRAKEVQKNWAPLSNEHGTARHTDTAVDGFLAVTAWDPIAVAECKAHPRLGWRNTTCKPHYQHPDHDAKSFWSMFTESSIVRGGSQLIPLPTPSAGATDNTAAWLGFVHTRFNDDLAHPLNTTCVGYFGVECECIHATHMVVVLQHADPTPRFTLQHVTPPLHFYHVPETRLGPNMTAVAPFTRAHDAIVDPVSIVKFDHQADSMLLSLNVGDQRLVVAAVNGAFRLAHNVLASTVASHKVGAWEREVYMMGRQLWAIWIAACPALQKAQSLHEQRDGPLRRARMVPRPPPAFEHAIDAPIVADITPKRGDVKRARRFMFPALRWDERGWFDAVYRVDGRWRRRRRRRTKR